MIRVNGQFRFVRRVKQGDYLEHNGDQVKVEKIEIVDQVGVYSILTESGMMEVNGILVSCYSNIEDQDLV